MSETAEQRTKAPYHHGDLREALLVAAEQELIERGIEGFTLRGVAKRAGVSHAAPAHHFRDTSDLLTALATVAAGRFYQTMKGRQDKSSKDPRSQFLASGQGYIEFALANPALFDLMFGSKRPDFKSAEFVRQAGDSFGILVSGIAALRGVNPLETASGRIDILTSWSLVHGIAKLLIADRLAFVQQDLEADLEGTILKAIERVVPGDGPA
jgi:AcrR family transcriptional regulator